MNPRCTRALAGLTAALVFGVADAAAATACQVPPERRLPHALVALSNSVGPGIVNTLFGVLAIVGYTVAAPFSEEIDLPRFKLSPTGIQILVIVAENWYDGGTSLGWFVIEGSDLEVHEPAEEYQLHTLHETGHAYQSALLGPLYLPFVGIDYAIHGGGNHTYYFKQRHDRGGFSRHPDDDAWVETWADRFAARGGPTDHLSSEQIAALIGCPD